MRLVTCLILAITSTLLLLVPFLTNLDAIFGPPLPWWVFRPFLALQDALFDFVQATTPPHIRVMDLATGYWKSEVMYALTIHGIPDALANDRLSCEEVAHRRNLHEHVTCEYMRAGASLGLFQEHGVGEKASYSLSDAGGLLRSDLPGSLRDLVLLLQQETQQAWRAAGTTSIHTGRSGFLEALGAEFWDYHQHHVDQSAQFDRAMHSFTLGTMPAILGDWVPANKTGTLCDIGGGLGTAVRLVLDQYPHMTALVLDQPEVAARAAEILKGNDRIRAVPGSFFEPFPADLEQCDTFFLKFVLHDWPDEDCVTILKNIGRVAKPKAELALAEFVVGSSASPRMELTKRLMSINMLASNKFGARERTLEQFQKLVDDAGLGQTCGSDGTCHGKLEAIPTRDLVSVLRLRL